MEAHSEVSEQLLSEYFIVGVQSPVLLAKCNTFILYEHYINMSDTRNVALKSR